MAFENNLQQDELVILYYNGISLATEVWELSVSLEGSDQWVLLSPPYMRCLHAGYLFSTVLCWKQGFPEIIGTPWWGEVLRTKFPAEESHHKDTE